MKILVLNGSPKGKNSNTMKITNSFIDGINIYKEHDVEIIDIIGKNIEHCFGCFKCWNDINGKCIIKDDMEVLIKNYLDSDIIIWSFPLYYFGMPSKIKAFLDRLLPTNLPFIDGNTNNGASHVPRYDMSHHKHVLISTCGFHSIKHNYEALSKQFDIMFGNSLEKIICPEGELFRVEQFNTRVKEYLEYVKEAGTEYKDSFNISNETRDNLSELLCPPDLFIELANASWDLPENYSPDSGETPDKNIHKESLTFMKQMKAVYNPSSFEGDDIILEFFFSDIDRTYQLNLTSNKCELITENFDDYTTRIEAAFELWEDISKGKINGADAMMQKKYKVHGDFSVMMNMDRYFGVARSTKKKTDEEDEKETNMLATFLPWIAIWIILPVNSLMAGIAGVLVSGGVALLSEKYKLTIYDKINSIFASAIGICAVLGIATDYLLMASYFSLGTIWGISCIFKVPFTAYYSINDFDNKELMNNPLFLRTNKILTFMWSIVYFIVGLISIIVIEMEIASIFIFIINTIIFMTMLAFTKWFSNWYPSYFAKANN